MFINVRRPTKKKIKPFYCQIIDRLTILNKCEDIQQTMILLFNEPQRKSVLEYVYVLCLFRSKGTIIIWLPDPDF